MIRLDIFFIDGGDASAAWMLLKQLLRLLLLSLCILSFHHHSTCSGGIHWLLTLVVITQINIYGFVGSILSMNGSHIHMKQATTGTSAAASTIAMIDDDGASHRHDDRLLTTKHSFPFHSLSDKAR
jgi:hypothetical protein